LTARWPAASTSKRTAAAGRARGQDPAPPGERRLLERQPDEGEGAERHHQQDQQREAVEAEPAQRGGGAVGAHLSCVGSKAETESLGDADQQHDDQRHRERLIGGQEKKFDHRRPRGDLDRQ